MRLDEAFEAIMDNALAKLQAEQVEGGLLAEVTTIVRGDRARPSPPTPSLWLFGEQATPSHEPTTIQESWMLPLLITPVYQSIDPEVGYRKASEIAAKGRSILLADRTLGLRELVQDVRSGRFEPSAPWHNQGNLYSAVAVLQVTFRIRE